MSKLGETISVTWEDTWEECDHAGCSGSEGILLIATKPGKVVSVRAASCFGIDREVLIAELLTKWGEN